MEAVFLTALPGVGVKEEVKAGTFLTLWLAEVSSFAATKRLLEVKFTKCRP